MNKKGDERWTDVFSLLMTCSLTVDSHSYPWSAVKVYRNRRPITLWLEHFLFLVGKWFYWLIIVETVLFTNRYYNHYVVKITVIIFVPLWFIYKILLFSSEEGGKDHTKCTSVNYVWFFYCQWICLTLLFWGKNFSILSYYSLYFCPDKVKRDFGFGDVCVNHDGRSVEKTVRVKSKNLLQKQGQSVIWSQNTVDNEVQSWGSKSRH